MAADTVVMNEFIQIVPSANPEFQLSSNCENIENELNFVIEENNIALSEMHIINELSKLIFYTLNSQIKSDIMKITTNSYNEYDDKNAIIEALDLNINNLIVKSNSLIEGSVKVKNSFKVKGQKLSNIVERISLIEKEIKNLSTIVAYYQNVNITEGNKEDYKTTNDDYSKI